MVRIPDKWKDADDATKIARAIAKNRSGEACENESCVHELFMVLRFKSDQEHLRQEALDRLRQYLPKFGFELVEMESRTRKVKNDKD